MSNNRAAEYTDSQIRCDDNGLTIRRYYPWGAKRISYTAIKGVKALPLVGANKMRRWRIWGSGDFVHWWNLDTQRPSRSVALVIDAGRRVLPTITPDDPDAVRRILSERTGNA